MMKEVESKINMNLDNMVNNIIQYFNEEVIDDIVTSAAQEGTNNHSVNSDVRIDDINARTLKMMAI